MTIAGLKLVRSLDEVRDNIKRYQTEVAKHPELAKRASLVRAWYVEPDDAGGYLFAPSKFIGYRFSSGEHYLTEALPGQDPDGGATERLLSNWFAPVDQQTALGKELSDRLSRLLAHHDVRPNKRARINIPLAMVDDRARSGDDEQRASTLLDRIVSDAAVCGGRPVIRGTRMRVSDILDALASGATRDTLIKDFDYLTPDDVSAALVYASRNLDHRVISTR